MSHPEPFCQIQILFLFLHPRLTYRFQTFNSFPRYQKKLQQQYIDSLKSNGVIGKSIEENLQLPSIIPEPFEIDTIDDVKPDSHNDYDTPIKLIPFLLLWLTQVRRNQKLKSQTLRKYQS